MNKEGAAYAATLDAQRYDVEVTWFELEGVNLKLAENTFYTPDFGVMLVDGALEVHEVKEFWQDDARKKDQNRG